MPGGGTLKWGGQNGALLQAASEAAANMAGRSIDNRVYSPVIDPGVADLMGVGGVPVLSYGDRNIDLVRQLAAQLGIPVSDAALSDAFYKAAMGRTGFAGDGIGSTVGTNQMDDYALDALRILADGAGMRSAFDNYYASQGAQDLVAQGAAEAEQLKVLNEAAIKADNAKSLQTGMAIFSAPLALAGGLSALGLGAIPSELSTISQVLGATKSLLMGDPIGGAMSAFSLAGGWDALGNAFSGAPDLSGITSPEAGFTPPGWTPSDAIGPEFGAFLRPGEYVGYSPEFSFTPPGWTPSDAIGPEWGNLTRPDWMQEVIGPEYGGLSYPEGIYADTVGPEYGGLTPPESKWQEMIGNRDPSDPDWGLGLGDSTSYGSGAVADNGSGINWEELLKSFSGLGDFIGSLASNGSDTVGPELPIPLTEAGEDPLNMGLFQRNRNQQAGGILGGFDSFNIGAPGLFVPR